MKTASLMGKLVSVGLLIMIATHVDARSTYAPLKTKTIQNLSRGPGNLFGLYFNADPATGEVRLISKSSQIDSGTFWQICQENRQRDYTAQSIRNRGNSKFNGYFLSIDEATGQVKLVDNRSRDDYATRWLVRYAGYFNGHHSYFIQNLAASSGGFDMSFLTVDETNGNVVLRPTPDAAAHWSLRPSLDMPSEVIR